jgi:hypothetical protein
MTRFAQTIAAKAFHRELAAARQLGGEDVECYASALRAMDDTFGLCLEPDRPLLTLPMRMIVGKRE